MNVLGLVFSLLLILSCTFSLSLGRDLKTARIEKLFAAHLLAERKLLNAFETKEYERIRKVPHKSESSSSNKEAELAPRTDPLQENCPCARLNLWPLLEDPLQHKARYDAALVALSFFYRQPLLENDPRRPRQILDALLAAAKTFKKKGSAIPLEKLSLGPEKQPFYYAMLKGTRRGVPAPYPSLLDLFSLEEAPSNICLAHSSSAWYQALFGKAAGKALYREHVVDRAPLTRERIQQAAPCSEEFLDLFDLGSGRHGGSPPLGVEQDGVYVRLMPDSRAGRS